MRNKWLHAWTMGFNVMLWNNCELQIIVKIYINVQVPGWWLMINNRRSLISVHSPLLQTKQTVLKRIVDIPLHFHFPMQLLKELNEHYYHGS